VVAFDRGDHLAHGIEVGHVAEGERGGAAVQARGGHGLRPFLLGAGDRIVGDDEMPVVGEALADRRADAATPPVTRTTLFFLSMINSDLPKKNPSAKLGFEPLSKLVNLR
jgi:hypothetical protein